MFLKRTVLSGLCLMLNLAAMPGNPGNHGVPGNPVNPGNTVNPVNPDIPGQEQPQRTDSIRNIDIMEVTVMASRTENRLQNLPRKIEIISEDRLTSVPSENLAEALKRSVNLDVIQYPGTLANVGMRGFSPTLSDRNYTLVLINGKPSATVNVATVKLSNIERVEVIKGPYSVLYGSDAMAGVINIITKQESEGPEAMVSIESGSFGNLSLDGSFAGNISEKVGFRLGYSRMEQTKDYRIGDNNLLDISGTGKKILMESSYGGRMKNSQYEINQANGLLSIRPDTRWHISAEAVYTYAYDLGAPTGIPGPLLGYTQTKKDINRINLMTTVGHDCGSNRFSFSPYLSRQSGSAYSDDTDDGFVNLKTKISEYGFQLQDVQSIWQFNLLAGFDYRAYDYASERWEEPGKNTFPYQPDNKTSNMGVFAQLTWSTPVFDIDAGLRYEHIKYKIEANEDLNAAKTDETYSTLNPSIGAQARFVRNMKVHTAFGSAFKTPNPYQVAGSYTTDFGYGVHKYTGNPGLKPEKSITVDAGVGYYSAENSLMLDVTYFYTYHDDKIVTESDYTIGETSYKNASNATMEGIELMASYDIGNISGNKFKLEFYSNWTWMLRNEFETNTGGDTNTKDSQFVRKTNGNFGVIFAPKPFLSVRLNGRYTGSRLERDYFTSSRYDEDAGKYIEESIRGIETSEYHPKGGYETSDFVLKHPDFLVFDCSVKYSFKKNLDFGIMLSNFLDENYTEKDGYNMPGRQITAKLAYKF